MGARGLLGRVVFPVLVVLAGGALYLPLPHAYPTAGLDPSWRFGLNESQTLGFVFGREIVYTVGPYTSLWSRIFHPGTFLFVLFAGLVLTACFAVLLLSVARRASPSGRWALLAAVLACGFSRDAPFLVYPVLALVAVVAADSGDRGQPWRTALLAAVAVFPFGLLGMVKGTFGFAAFGLAGVLFLRFVYRREFPAALGLVASLVLGGLSLWVLSGQPLSGLPAYFIEMLPLVRGYSTANVFSGPALDVGVSAVLGLVLVVLAWRRGGARWVDRGALAVGMAGLGLVAFKAGFVRHDHHEMLAFLFLVAAGMLFRAAFRGRGFALVAVGGCVLAAKAMLLGPHAEFHRSVAATRISALAVAPYQLARYALDGGTSAERAYGRALRRMAEEVPLPDPGGAADLYSYDVAILLANGLEWSPRPTVQSHAAYERTLAEANRDHLLGDGAPEFLFIRLETIDDRFVPLDDSLSWPVWLRHYRPVRFVSDFLLLARKEPGVLPPPVLRPAGRRSVAWGEAFELPDTSGPLFLSVGIERNLAGSLVKTFFKSPRVELELTMADGEVHVFSLPPSMADSPFLIRPMVLHGYNLGRLFLGDTEALPRPVSARVQSDGNAFFRETMEVRFFELPDPTDEAGAPAEAWNPPGALVIEDRPLPHYTALVLGDPGGLGFREGWLAPPGDPAWADAAPVLLVERADGSWQTFPLDRFAFPPASEFLGLEGTYVGFRTFSFLGGEDASGLRFSLGYRQGDRLLRAVE